VPGPRPQGLDLASQREQQRLAARGRAELYRQRCAGGVDAGGTVMDGQPARFHGQAMAPV
jgi:hypothetical protein